MPEPSRSVASEELLEQFEEAWRAGAPPRLESFLPPVLSHADTPARRRWLEELVLIDLEQRWRRWQTLGRPPRLEEYPARCPGLTPGLPLIAYEYRVRHCWGDRPGHAEYQGRFARHGAELERALAQVDAELADEAARKQRRLQGQGPARGMEIMGSSRPAHDPRSVALGTASPLTSVAALVDTLSQTPLLAPAQHQEMSRTLAPRFSEPRTLIQALLQRGWLTPYQANRLLQGRVGELLLGPYLLLDRLGEGGAGQVFKARHQKMNRLAAVKMIRPELLADDEAVSRFYREIHVIAQLHHPNVVHAFDAGPAAGTHFLAMEYVEGTDLGRLVKQGGPLPVQQACEYIRQAALGLQHAHERGVVHRDIKPHNLILSVAEGLIKVSDLGLSRLPRATNQEATAVLTGVKTDHVTPEGAVMMGTIDYLAPEQAVDFHRADIRADIYSLGCTFYYLLTGVPPFLAETLAQKLLKHQRESPRPVGQLRSGLPAGLGSIVAQMLAKRPEERFQTPGEVAAVLEPYCRPELARDQGALGRVWSRTRRQRRWLVAAGRRHWLLTGTTALLVLVGLVFLLVPRGSGPDSRVFQESPLDLLEPGKSSGVVWKLVQGEANRSVGFNLSPDGKTVVAHGGATIRRWDIATRQELPAITVDPPPDFRVLSKRFTPDSRHLAIVGNLAQIFIYDATTGTRRQTLRDADWRGHEAAKLVFTRDGKMLAVATTVADQSSPLVLLDVERRREIWRSQRRGRFTALFFTPDNRALVIGTALEPDFRFVDVASGTDLAAIPHGKVGGQELGIAISADGHTAATVGNEGILEMWNLPERRREQERLVRGVTSLAASPDGQTFFLTAPGGIQQWALDRKASQALNQWPLEAAAKIVVVAPDNRHLLCYNEQTLTVSIFRTSKK
jgi:serine/threonine-protein kinase